MTNKLWGLKTWSRCCEVKNVVACPALVVWKRSVCWKDKIFLPVFWPTRIGSKVAISRAWCPPHSFSIAAGYTDKGWQTPQTVTDREWERESELERERESFVYHHHFWNRTDGQDVHGDPHCNGRPCNIKKEVESVCTVQLNPPL